MKTRYTAFIEDGEITSGPDFLMLCAREFGACVSMRDEPLATPIPDQFVPKIASFDIEIERLENRLRELASMSFDDAQRAANQELRNIQNDHIKQQKRARAVIERYDAISQQIKGWTPPTQDHQLLKSFALKQIETCCKDMRDLDQPLVGVILTGEQWLEREIAVAERALADARESREREIALTDARNKWIRDLRESLKQSCDSLY